MTKQVRAVCKVCVGEVQKHFCGCVQDFGVVYIGVVKGVNIAVAFS